jgi:predicted transposase/invertase (TIGR01784 family)
MRDDRIRDAFRHNMKKTGDGAMGSNANRQYKDTVFTLLLNDENIIREVYGAITDTVYGPETKIEINTIRNILSRGRINDISFIVNGKFVVLVEHQSTISENMPLRMLLYIAELYNRYIERESIYRKSKIPIHRAEFVILYNGTEEMPDDVVVSKLSDMYIDPVPAGQEPALELVVTTYNINKGRNPDIAKRSPTLYEYETFIDTVREYEKDMPLKAAITKAVRDCIDNNILKQFLINHEPEVVDMLFEEWDMDTALKVQKEEGREEGRMEEKKRMARALQAKGHGVNDIADITGLAVDDVLRL